MTVYVDNMRLPRRVGQLDANWSHLFAVPPDDPELHRLANGIGLRGDWYQTDGSYPHYDVTDDKRRQAMAAGAVPVTWTEGARLRKDHRNKTGGQRPTDSHQARAASGHANRQRR